ncbi:MAG: hypothetical protein HUJ70_03200 [Pseudobutyrivibrio sp.]|nr:hypothetical protein [Pseudobutyrivibrio sp.]
MRLKRLVLTVVLVCFALGSTGCGEKLISMTEDEEELIALYSANVISKFNQKQNHGLCRPRIREGELDDVMPAVAEEIEFVEEETPEEVTNYPVENDVVDVAADTGNEVLWGSSLSDCIGIEGMEFSLDSFDVTPAYKASASFILQESSGKKYLVLKLKGKNITDSTIALDNSAGNDSVYTLILNDQYRAEALKTVIINDLTSYYGKINASEEKDFILIFTYPDSQVEGIGALSLEVTDNGVTRGTAF